MLILSIVLAIAITGHDDGVVASSAQSGWLAKREMLSHEAERLRDAYAHCATNRTELAEEVVLPLDTYEDGSLKTVIKAKNAQILPKEGFILAWGLTILKLDSSGKELSKIEAESCLVDRSTKSGWAEGPGSVVNGKNSFSGENVYFSSLEGYATSFRKSKLVSDAKSGSVVAGGLLKEMREAQTLVIASERCDFDREDGIVLFDGDAAISYATDYTMNANRLWVYFSGSNELDRVIAEGNVTLTNEMRIGVCDRAIYCRRTGEIEMFGGKDGSLARLAELGSKELAGCRIKFFVDAEQVEVIESEITLERGERKTPQLNNLLNGGSANE